MFRTIFMALGLALPISLATGSYTPSITIQHVFSVAGTATLTHGLGVARPNTTCSVSDPTAVWSLQFVNATSVSLTTDRPLDIACTFTPGGTFVGQ